MRIMVGSGTANMSIHLAPSTGARMDGAAVSRDNEGVPCGAAAAAAASADR